MLNKKSQTPQDLIFLVVFLFFISIGSVIAFFIYNSIYDKFTTSEVITSDPNINQTVTQAMSDAKAGMNNLDFVILFIYIGLTLGMVILGWLIDVQSPFIFIYVLILMIGELVAGIISYVWTHFSSQIEFSSIIISNFKITNHLLSYLALYFLFSGMLSLIITFGKSKEGI